MNILILNIDQRFLLCVMAMFVTGSCAPSYGHEDSNFTQNLADEFFHGLHVTMPSTARYTPETAAAAEPSIPNEPSTRQITKMLEGKLEKKSENAKDVTNRSLADALGNVSISQVQDYLETAYRITRGGEGSMLPRKTLYRVSRTGFFKVTTFDAGMICNGHRVSIAPITYEGNAYVIAIEQSRQDSRNDSWNYVVFGVDYLFRYQNQEVES